MPERCAVATAYEQGRVAREHPVNHAIAPVPESPDSPY